MRHHKSLDIDAVINSLLQARYFEPNTEIDLPEEQIILLVEAVTSILMDQPILLELPAPIKICGIV